MGGVLLDLGVARLLLGDVDGAQKDFARALYM
jgi:hypothetical protein